MFGGTCAAFSRTVVVDPEIELQREVIRKALTLGIKVYGEALAQVIVVVYGDLQTSGCASRIGRSWDGQLLERRVVGEEKLVFLLTVIEAPLDLVIVGHGSGIVTGQECPVRG